MNILTFDIEEWYFQKYRLEDNKEKYTEYNNYLDIILDSLDEHGYKATFFCVGGMGRDFSDVVKKIEAKGHEIGCHSFSHTWLNKLSPEEAVEDTHRAVDSLEQCIGKKIKSYRAPAFSIGEKNLWAFDILADCGIERDASVFPTVRDFGGFPNFGHKTPVLVRHGESEIKEFPVCTTRLLGREIAYSGGGYFRLFPLRFVKHEMVNNDYVMTYFHIADLIPESRGVMTRQAYERSFKEPGTLMARYKRYLKSNLGKKSAFSKLLSLIETTDFINLEQADQMIDWNLEESIIL